MANRPSYPGTPRWVKATGIVVIVLLVLVVVMLLAGHDPGRHGSSGDAGSRVALFGVTDGHVPAGG